MVFFQAIGTQRSTKQLRRAKGNLSPRFSHVVACSATASFYLPAQGDRFLGPDTRRIRGGGPAKRCGIGCALRFNDSKKESLYLYLRLDLSH